MTGFRVAILLVVLLTPMAWAAGCGDGATDPPPPTPPPDPPRPATVTVSPATAGLTALGATVQLSARVLDQNGQAMAGTPVTWASSAAGVATVSSAGLVTAAANGTTTITATAGGVSATATVTVAQEVGAVAVSPASSIVVAGDTLRLAAEATDANGHVVAGAEFTWASGDTALAVVGATGLVTGVAAGEVEITATADGVVGRAALVVQAPAPATVTVAPEVVALVALGDTARLMAEVRDQLGRMMEGEPVAWASSDDRVASVDSTGLVTAAGNGTATIAATAGSASGTASVRVMQSASSVVVSPPADTIAPGDTLRLAAEAADANGHAVPEAELSWASGEPAVATVDGSGLVTGVAEGVATIAAMTGSARGTAQITVEKANRAPVVVGAIPPHTMTPGETSTLDLTPFFSDPDGDPLAYSASSEDPEVVGASVSDSRVTVTAWAPGTATVTVTASDPGGLTATRSTSVTGTTSILTAIRDIDAFLDQCPQNDEAAYHRIRQDFELRRDGELVTDPIACSEPVSRMPRDPGTLETSYPLQYFQLLRLAYYMNDGTEGRLPWTDKGLYEWMATNISGVNYKTASGSGYCCDVIDGALYISRALSWSGNGESGPLIFPVDWASISGSLAFFAHETRHADDDDPGHVACEFGPGACDATYDLNNLGAYGVHYWLPANWASGHLNVGIGCSPEADQHVAHNANQANRNRPHFVANPPPHVEPVRPYGGPCIPPDSPWR